jgi:formylglycine-generating enzyme required for sulfatase activity
VGDGLKGVPRGTIKSMRLITYHFAYQGMGGQQNRVGMDGPWDVKQVLGTVPVETDGSALFRVPANTPISVQPLDAEGKAVQLMRSWMTAMPGETLSCVGCHEKQSSSPPVKPTIAARRVPSEIEPFYGPTRGFSFNREVQPVLDKYCVGCHNGSARDDGKVIPDFQYLPDIVQVDTKYPPAYYQLRRLVRSVTMESDMNLLMPAEYHADTTELIQKLKKGHHGVELDKEAWDRLITWIDLHAPAQGTWHEIMGEGPVNHMRDRRRAMYSLYGGRDEDPEEIINPYQPVAFMEPQLQPESASEKIVCENWPLRLEEAKQQQNASGKIDRIIDLGEGITLELVYIPAGEFILGDLEGQPDEKPLAKVAIKKPFWMGKFEITNAQYRQFDPQHDSRYEPGDFIQLAEDDRGITVNEDNQPVVRVSWEQAMAFCAWLKEKTGESFVLPSEAQWEYACRAGTDTPFWYGDLETDFSEYANFADLNLHMMDSFDFQHPIIAVPAWRPADLRVNDGFHVSAPVGSFKPNSWGLYDMHGNVWEWTSSDHPSDGNTHRKVVRGGSWYDRPMRGRSAFRLSYNYYQGVYNVGFRVVSQN